MDAKVTLSFEQSVIENAKEFAKANNISLSRLTEFLLRKISEKQYQSLDDLPVSEWVTMVAEGEATYKRRNPKELKNEYYKSKK